MAGVVGRSGGSNRRSLRERELAGTRRRDREPQAIAGGAPERPTWLEADAYAVEAWDWIVAEMTRRRTLSLDARDAVVLAAKACSEYRRADEILLRDGLTVDTGGAPVMHPACRVRDSAWRRWSAALATLGLSPHMRDRVGRAPEEPGHNPYADV
jgi:P27 family predicted phage terminase small subunit